MATLYDSGWVTGSSGTINAAVPTRGCTQARVIYAASGTFGAATASLAWTAGAGTVVPWAKTSVNYPVVPLVTSAFPGAIAAPGANSSVVYYLGANVSGSGGTQVSPYVPDVINVLLQPSSSAWARAIVEGAGAD